MGSCGGGDEGGGAAGGDLLGEGGAGEDGDGVVGDGGDDLGHAEEAGLLDALAGAEDDLVGGEERGDVGDDAAEVLRGDDAEDDVGLEDGAGEVGGDVDVAGRVKPGR